MSIRALTGAAVAIAAVTLAMFGAYPHLRGRLARATTPTAPNILLITDLARPADPNAGDHATREGLPYRGVCERFT
jgi:hypothetical protein